MYKNSSCSHPRTVNFISYRHSTGSNSNCHPSFIVIKQQQQQRVQATNRKKSQEQIHKLLPRSVTTAIAHRFVISLLLHLFITITLNTTNIMINSMIIPYSYYTKNLNAVVTTTRMSEIYMSLSKIHQQVQVVPCCTRRLSNYNNNNIAFAHTLRTTYGSGTSFSSSILSSVSRWSPSEYEKRPHCSKFVLFSSSSTTDSKTAIQSSDSSVTSGNKKRIIFLGSPPVAAETLQTIYESSQHDNSMYDIIAVISQPPKRGKRGVIEPTAVSKMAQQLNISTIITPDKANDPNFIQDFISLYPDLCITAAYGQYLPKVFLQTPKYGTINIHPSLLPKWRGASPVQRSLEAGDNPLGVSVLYTISKMDAGPIITQSTLEVEDHETTTTLLPKLFHIGTQSLIKVLPQIFDGSITMDTATKQNEEQVTYAKLIDSTEAQLQLWQESATTCHNRLRGFHMWPKVYIYIQIISNNNNDDPPPPPIKLIIHETRVIKDVQISPTNILQYTLPQTNSSTTNKVGLYVICYDGSVLELITIQPPSKKPYPARDFIHGYPNATIQWIQPQIQQPMEDVSIPIIETAATSKN